MCYGVTNMTRRVGSGVVNAACAQEREEFAFASRGDFGVDETRLFTSDENLIDLDIQICKQGLKVEGFAVGCREVKCCVVFTDGDFEMDRFVG